MFGFEELARSVISNLPTQGSQSLEEVQNSQNPPSLWSKIRDIEGAIKKIKPSDVNTLEVPDLTEEDFDAIERGVWAYGIEALAFYKSIHFVDDKPYPGKWGIFIFDYAVAALAEEINIFYPGRFSRRECITKAERYLHRHERLHFRLDAWLISHEAISVFHIKEIAPKPLYANYQREVYQRLHPDEDCVEESLANRHALDSMNKEGIREFMKMHMSRQPGAYANYNRKIVELREAVAGQMLFSVAVGWQVAMKLSSSTFYPQGPWIVNGRNYLLRDENCPVYVIANCKPTSIIAPSLSAPGFKEHEDFVQNYLAGRQQAAADHEYYVIDNGECLKMPNSHSNTDRLKPGEFKNNLSKAGMTPKEYRDERTRTKGWVKNVPRTVVKEPRKH